MKGDRSNYRRENRSSQNISFIKSCLSYKKVLNLFVNELIKIHSNFFWKNILPKIKLKTFLLDQNHGG